MVRVRSGVSGNTFSANVFSRKCSIILLAEHNYESNTINKRQPFYFFCLGYKF